MGRSLDTKELSEPFNSLNWVLPVGRLTSKHDTVTTIDDRVLDVITFSIGWFWVLNHTFEVLGSAEAPLATFLSSLYDGLLVSWEVWHTTFNSHITTSNHDDVAFGNNRINILDSSWHFDLRNKLAVMLHEFSDSLNVVGSLNEREHKHWELELISNLDADKILLGWEFSDNMSIWE